MATNLGIPVIIVSNDHDVLEAAKMRGVKFIDKDSFDRKTLKQALDEFLTGNSQL